MAEQRWRWAGAHAYRDHANDRSIGPGEELPADIADRVAASHPRDVESIEGDDAETDDGVEWTEEAWLDGSYGERRDAVEDGRVDEHLADIEAVETSDTVIEAVEARRAELADEE